MNRTQTDIQTALNERHQDLLINEPSILMICWLKMTVCKPVLHSSLMILFISTWTWTQTNSTWQNHCGGGNRPVGIRGMFPMGNSFLRNCTQNPDTSNTCWMFHFWNFQGARIWWLISGKAHDSNLPSTDCTPEIHVLGGNLKPIPVFKGVVQNKRPWPRLP